MTDKQHEAKLGLSPDGKWGWVPKQGEIVPAHAETIIRDMVRFFQAGEDRDLVEQVRITARIADTIQTQECVDEITARDWSRMMLASSSLVTALQALEQYNNS